MVIIGKTDQLEHMYKEKFRFFARNLDSSSHTSVILLLATWGLGLHLTLPMKDEMGK